MSWLWLAWLRGKAADSLLQATAGEEDKSLEEEEVVGLGVVTMVEVAGVVDNEEAVEADKNYEEEMVEVGKN